VKLCWLLALVGCDHPSSHPIDAAPVVVDTDPNFCDVSADSGHAALSIGGTSHTFSRVYAGGVLLVGPADIAPSNGPPMTLKLLFTDGDHLSQETLSCCSASGSSCCTLDGAIGDVDTAEIGAHPVRLSSFQDSSFTAQGTITVTDYIGPYQTAPSRIAGSISTTSSGDGVNAMFDTTFCPLLLSATI